jgi:AmmeMemoRadiSam system protein B/AmmeMemoRadiSam system protein A
VRTCRVLCWCVAGLLAWSVSACAEESESPITGSSSASQDKGPVRRPAVAGGFYPADPKELSAMVDAFVAEAQVPALEGVIRAMVVPHAGYVYSGGVAAHAFKAIAGKSYQTVVVLGNSHHEGFYGASVYSRGAFRTPLGEIPIDEDMAQKLMAAEPLIAFRESTHIPEHSLEVELPFLQRVLGDFKLVPILLGDRDTALARAVGQALAKVADETSLVVASSDLSHYPAYDDARFADQKTLEALTTCDVDQLERTLRQLERMRIPNTVTLMCGEGAVKALLFYADAVGARRGVLLKYANSGDSKYGKKDGVVGYGAVVFLAESTSPQRTSEAAATNAPAGEESESGLGVAEHKELLRLARLTVETFVRTGRRPAYTNSLPALEKPMGAFVTLKKKGQLRGCIGRFEPTQPLYEVVMDMAVAAATQDHRFPPVRESELADLEYEVSVLSPLRRVKSWREIRYGRHGVQIARGWHRGVFLPQVAEETGWDFETFMDNLCAHKAGLPPKAWKDPETEVYVFTADVISEHEKP